MEVLKDWRRRALGAAAGAAVVPVAVTVAALAVGVGGGSLGDVRALGQAVSGPDLPPVAPALGERSRTTADEAGRILARVRPGRPAAARPSRDVAGGATSDASGQTAPAAPDAPAAPPAPPGDGPVAAVPPPASDPPAPAPPPARAPAPSPSPLREAADQVTAGSDGVPVAGPAAGQVLDVLADTIDPLPRLVRP